MKRSLLFVVFVLLCAQHHLQAQVTVLDFETSATSTNFTYFGSSLDGTSTSVIANPNPSGINTSAQVLEFKKPANAQTWAGAFSNPNPATSVNLTNGGLIRVLFHTDHVGNLALKLEESTNGGSNWIQKVEVTEVNQWIELVYNPALPSLEGPFSPATGYNYNKIVLFADFGTSAPVSYTYYIDDIRVTDQGVGPADAQITFKLNMSQYSGAFTKVYVSGSFNNWSGDGFPMTHMGNDNYETTLNIPLGAHEFKFTIDNWAQQEYFTPTNACTKTTIDGSNIFTNRQLLVSGDAVYGPVCFNSCYNCGEAVNITFNLGLGDTPPGNGGVFLAGGLEFGAPGGHYKMAPTGSNNMYTITIQRNKGYSGYYTYANGACPDYSCKENIAGQPCAFPNNFNDRFLNPVMQDTILMQCFGQCEATTNCTTSADNIGAGSLLTVYPVPTDDAIRWSFDGSPSQSKELQITDLTGRVVMFKSLPPATNAGTVSLSNLQPGAYFLLLKQGSQQVSARVIKL